MRVCVPIMEEGNRKGVRRCGAPGWRMETDMRSD